METRVLFRRCGFTLIELLIVVAIIGILAAIAIPNFTGARVRSKVARTKADQQAESVALESYRLDTNNYPPNFQWKRLTTPVAYMTTLPLDPFGPIIPADSQGYGQVTSSFGTRPVARQYIFFGPEMYDQNPSPKDSFAKRYNIWWSLTGLGPDRTWFDKTGPPYRPYDPSNGIMSNGNIERLGPGNTPDQRYRFYWG